MQRNGQNPIRSAKLFDHASAKPADAAAPVKHGGPHLVCPACKTEIPPRPGFRVSSLKCPKCGASPVKR